MSRAQSHSPTGRFHAAVWIDHHEARIFRFDSDVTAATQRAVRDQHSAVHLHHKANSVGSGRVAVNHPYLESVAAEISDAQAILIVGPASAKHELYKYIAGHHPQLLNRIVGVETLDHPGDGPLLTHAAHAFRVAAQVGRPYSPAHG